MNKSCFALSLALMIITSRPSPAGPNKGTAPPPLQLLEIIPMPNVAGRIDHIEADNKHHRLLISAIGNNTVEVVDFSMAKWITSISGMNAPKGILYLPEFGKLFVVNIGDGTLKIYDDSYTEIKTFDTGTRVDFIRYDPASKKVFVPTSVGASKTEGGIAIIDPVTLERVDTIKLDGPPEDFAIEASGKRMFANVHTSSTVDSIDLKTHKVTKWELNNAYKPTPMALDEAGHRLFVISRAPPVMVVLDTETGREVARLPVGGISADLFYDQSSKRIYNTNGAGYISVFQQKDPDHYELIENVQTTVGARSGYFHPTFHRVFIAVPARGNEPAAIWEYQVNAPEVAPPPQSTK